MSEDQAREALLRYVESKWRYSSKPARNLTFRQLQPIIVYRVSTATPAPVPHPPDLRECPLQYRLETFTETRTSSWNFEVYNGSRQQVQAGLTRNQGV